nr:helix-turn-helix transcriptional regulator [Skermanella pratensis]
MAAAAGIGISTVADFERGQRTPMPNNAEAIARRWRRRVSASSTAG